MNHNTGAIGSRGSKGSSAELVTPELEAQFEQDWQQRVREEFGTRNYTNQEELALCRKLLGEADMGWMYLKGKRVQVNPSAIKPISPAAIAAASKRDTSGSGNRLKILLVAGGIIASLFVCSSLFISRSGGATSAQSKATVTAQAQRTASAVAEANSNSLTHVPQSTATPEPAPTLPPLFITSGDQRLPVQRPNTLEFGERSFIVYVAASKNGNWSVKQDATVANWLPGAVINWSFGIFLQKDTNASNWVKNLKVGDVVVMRLADGTARRFQISGLTTIARTQTEIFDPHQPGLNVVIKYDSSDDRLRIIGTELSESPGN